MLSRSTLFILLLTLCLVTCQEWYMPNSNLISDKQFDDKIKKDNTCFKFVKFFTPHCPYCRYLKAAFDQLKPKKSWCFKVYDFNCQWYPQFCTQNVRASSFPYTVVYDAKGDLVEEIHGFYPVPVISQIFDRIQHSCLENKGEKAPQNTQTPTKNEPQKQPEPEKHTEPSVSEQHQAEKSKKLESTQQTKQIEQTPNPQKQAQQAQNIASQNMNTNTSSMHPYFSYIFYTVCCLGSAYYIYSLQGKDQKEHDSDRLIPKADSEKRIQSPKRQDEPKLSPKKSSEQMHKQLEENQLLQIADEQL